jgi:hypothetical protein
MFQRFWITLPLLLLAACSGSPSSSSPSPSPSNPVAPAITVSSVTVNGSAPALGETSQFTATAALSDGTTQDVTGQATWQSSDASVAVVSSTGAVRSVAAGEADLTATYSGVTGSQHLEIVAGPAARRTLTGMISDDNTGRPLADGAETQILDGENAGKVGRADTNGAYAISDVEVGTFTLRARATGYESRDQHVTLDAADVRVDFRLRSQRRDVPCAYLVTPDSIPLLSSAAGQFSLTIRRTSGSCAWTAVTDASWIRLASTGGNADATLTFSYDARPVGTGDRSGNIRVEWAGGSANRTVWQAPGPPLKCSATMTIDGFNSPILPSSAGQYTASIQAAPGDACGPWLAEVHPGVSLIGPGGGRVPGNITFKVAANPGREPRTLMIIVVTTGLGDPSAVLSIEQAGTR